MSTPDLTWFKSSHSGSQGDSCVEVAWFKSSYSSGSSGDCVEVAWTKSTYSGSSGDDCIEIAAEPDAVLVRDSKDKAGPHLTFTPEAWAAFTEFTRES
ncbi:DUF397 domain-containing protein [Actinacidiphila yeochonensis]|uniref:DUF397 domain-containing protein n=1 Tax=Actinacidiphila yeochonensis TaxID=89050 RepID=UPI0005658C15|nr:DUF397 domain-containing protein [Actinacidiphila yeochonensis]